MGNKARQFQVSSATELAAGVDRPKSAIVFSTEYNGERGAYHSAEFRQMSFREALKESGQLFVPSPDKIESLLEEISAFQGKRRWFNLFKERKSRAALLVTLLMLITLYVLSLFVSGSDILAPLSALLGILIPWSYFTFSGIFRKKIYSILRKNSLRLDDVKSRDLPLEWALSSKPFFDQLTQEELYELVRQMRHYNKEKIRFTLQSTIEESGGKLANSEHTCDNLDESFRPLEGYISALEKKYAGKGSNGDGSR